MTANDDTPAEGQESIDWEAVGKDALAMLLDSYRMETEEETYSVIRSLRNGEEVTKEDLLTLRKSIESQHAVIESVIAENFEETEPSRW